MGIGLTLIGRRTASDPGRFLEDAARWLSQQDIDPQPSVRVVDQVVIAELHPAAEALELDAPDAQTVRVRAKTGTCGPGYHRFACELVHGLGDALGVAWSEEDDGDLTDYFFREDDAVLEESFLDWIGGVAVQMLEARERGGSHFSLSLPAGHVFEHDGLVATPLGPRDIAWVRAVIDEPHAGIDVFPWWHRERDARYYRGLALTEMWTNVRWRAPLDDAERALFDRVTTWIERAHALDPSLSLPWRAQSALLELASEESLRATRAHLKAESDPSAPIGYRRRPVRVELTGGWSMRVPGELAERWDERGTWVGWDAKRSVYFNSLTVRTEHGELSPSTDATLASLPPPGGEVLALERGELRGLASFVEEEHEGAMLLRLEAIAAIGANAAIGTIVLTDPKDREWALSTWGSLRRS